MGPILIKSVSRKRVFFQKANQKLVLRSIIYSRSTLFMVRKFKYLRSCWFEKTLEIWAFAFIFCWFRIRYFREISWLERKYNTYSPTKILHRPVLFIISSQHFIILDGAIFDTTASHHYFATSLH